MRDLVAGRGGDEVAMFGEEVAGIEEEVGKFGKK